MPYMDPMGKNIPSVVNNMEPQESKGLPACRIWPDDEFSCRCLFVVCLVPKTAWWLNQPIWRILVKLGSSSPRFGVKKKIFETWNHHLEKNPPDLVEKSLEYDMLHFTWHKSGTVCYLTFFFALEILFFYTTPMVSSNLPLVWSNTKHTAHNLHTRGRWGWEYLFK